MCESSGADSAAAVEAPQAPIHHFIHPLTGTEGVPMTNEMVDAGMDALRLYSLQPEAPRAILKIAAMMVFAAMTAAAPKEPI